MITKIKIISALIVSFFIVVFFAPQVFNPNSPKINPVFIARIAHTPSYVVSIPSKIVALFKPANSAELAAQAVFNSIPQAVAPPGLLLQTISKGVRAAEDPVSKTKYMQIDAGTQVEVNVFKLNDGREIKIIRPVTGK